MLISYFWSYIVNKIRQIKNPHLQINHFCLFADYLEAGTFCFSCYFKILYCSWLTFMHCFSYEACKRCILRVVGFHSWNFSTNSLFSKTFGFLFGRHVALFPLVFLSKQDNLCVLTKLDIAIITCCVLLGMIRLYQRPV